MDFVHDNLADGRSIRIFTLIDEATRECLHMEVDTSLNSLRVINVLIRFSPSLLYAGHRNVTPWYCSPGNKNENAFIESFNGRLRDECLNMHWFSSLKEARKIIETWRHHYNYDRPHSSLKGKTPIEVAIQMNGG